MADVSRRLTALRRRWMEARNYLSAIIEEEQVQGNEAERERFLAQENNNLCLLMDELEEAIAREWGSDAI